MSYYWFSIDGQADVLTLDQNAISITFPTINRHYTPQELFSDGNIITGNGSLIPGDIIFTNKLRSPRYDADYSTTYSGATAWNTFRYHVMKWLGFSKDKIIYFNVLDSNGITLRQRVYPFIRGSENYSWLKTSDPVSYTFHMEKAYFYNISASTTNYTATSTQMESFQVTNNGTLSVAPFFTFTPTGSFSSIQIQLLAGNYGFKLAASFAAGQPITFDCSTGVITVNGVITTGIQTAGSIFNLVPGNNTLYITATPGILNTSFNERYI